jgi:hypothetical protein
MVVVGLVLGVVIAVIVASQGCGSHQPRRNIAALDARATGLEQAAWP